MLCTIPLWLSEAAGEKIVRKEKLSDFLPSVNFPVDHINFGGDIWKPWLQEC